MYVKYFTAAYVYHLELECGTTHYSNKPRGMPRPKARKEESKTRESFIARKTERFACTSLRKKREREREKVEFHHLKGREKERKRKRRPNITRDDDS